VIQDDRTVELGFRAGYVEGYRAAVAGLSDVLNDEQRLVLDAWIKAELSPWSRVDDENGAPRAPVLDATSTDGEPTTYPTAWTSPALHA
jgi:hypothetical protein